MRHIESDEFTSLLRYLLRDIPYVECLTSHSCKETVLAWMAKFGADKPTLDFLGRHVGTITSSDIYARGMQFRPLSKLAMVLNAIRTGTFAPDETRSGQFRSRESCQPLEPLLATPQVQSQRPPARSPAFSTEGEDHEASERDFDGGRGPLQSKTPNSARRQSSVRKILRSLGMTDQELTELYRWLQEENEAPLKDAKLRYSDLEPIRGEAKG